MQVTQICAGRFHHFDLARQLVRLNALGRFFSGYPMPRLAREGIPSEQATSFPWLWLPYLALVRLRWGIGGIQRDAFYLAQDALDRHAARHLPESDWLIAFSGCGLHAGRAAQSRGTRYACDRAGSHIARQSTMLTEEYRHYGSNFPGIQPRLLQKELEEYDIADIVTVPSEFVVRSFIDMGMPREKLRKVPYGVDLRRFGKIDDPAPDTFDLLFVGEVSVRKGFRFLIEAFRGLRHPKKRLTVVGSIAPAISRYLRDHPPPEHVSFVGHLPQVQLKAVMSRAHAMLMPSIEEGLALVQGQAMACGCPVVASWNTGAEDLFTDGREGFIVRSGDVRSMTDRLQLLADDPALRARMSEAALRRVASIGGTDQYGDTMMQALSLPQPA